MALVLIGLYFFQGNKQKEDIKKTEVSYEQKEDLKKTEVSYEYEDKKTKSLVSQESYSKTIKLWDDIIDKNIFTIRNQYNGFSNNATLSTTNNQYWVTYYPNLNITLISSKKSDKILNADFGKKPYIYPYNFNNIRSVTGQKMILTDFHNYINSIQNGKAIKLTDKSCFNNDCLEYWSKSDFTTVIKYEFDKENDYATLMKIFNGKVENLLFLEYVETASILKLNEAKRNTKEIKEDGEIVGSWYCSMTGLDGVYSIINKNNKYYQYYYNNKDKSSEPTKVKKLIKISHKRYNIDYSLGGNVSSDYLVINDEGNLEFWDKQGYFLTCEKTK